MSRKMDDNPVGLSANISFLILLFAITLNSISFGVIVPVIPDLLSELTGLEQSLASPHAGWLLFIFAFFQFIFMPIFGALSDRYGRKKILLGSFTALFVDYFVMAMAQSVELLYFTRALAGVFGASTIIAGAYICDLFEGHHRAKYFGYIGAGAAIGLLLGPAIGGVLADISIRMPFYASAALLFLNVIFILSFFKDVAAKNLDETKLSLRKLLPNKTILKMFEKGPTRPYFFLLGAMTLAHTAYMAVFAFVAYAKFNWTPFEFGLCMAAFGAGGLIGQLFIVKRAVDLLGLEKSILYGMIFYFIGFVLIGFAHTPWMFYLAVPIASISGIFGATIKTKISLMKGNIGQGELQGIIGAVGGLALMIGPIIMTQTFKTSMNSPHLNSAILKTGSPFILCALISLICIFYLKSQPSLIDELSGASED